MAKGGHTVGQCDLLLEGRPVGALSWQEEGQGWQIHACCPVEEGMIYRVMLDLEGGSTWVAGGVMPEFGKVLFAQTGALRTGAPMGARASRHPRCGDHPHQTG